MGPETRHLQFEDVYPRYEFAPLVRIVITFAEWLKRKLEKRRIEAPHLKQTGGLLGGQH